MGQKTIFKLMIVIGSLISLSSCVNKKNVYQIDPALSPYYDLFLTVGKINGTDYSTNNLIMEIVDIDPVKYPDMVGYCSYYSDQRLINPAQSEYIDVPKVSIDRRFFTGATHEAKINLVFHELGHCVLNRRHDESIGQYGYPKSLMYPLILYSEDSFNVFIELLSVYYYKELFNPQTPQVDPQTLASVSSSLNTMNKVDSMSDRTHIAYFTTTKGCGLVNNFNSNNNKQGDTNDTQ